MRIFFLAALLFAGFVIHGQQIFNGIIHYKVSSPEDKKDEGEITIAFGKNLIKMKFTEDGSWAKQTMLINLDSGKLYHVDNEEKTFRTRRLREKRQYSEVVGKSIAGYKTTPADVSTENSFGAFGAFLNQGRVVFFVADSLYYPVPEKYAGNAELVFCHKNRIVLGCDMYFSSDMYSLPGYVDTMTKKMVIIEAFKIERKVMDPAEFMIPADYKEDLAGSWEMSDTTVVLDTTMIDEFDTLEYKKSVELPPPPPAKEPKKEPKKQTKKNPAKKED